MRITSLEIKDKEYKNLDIDLQENSSGVMAFIGNNGSGKSNLLESLSIIFYYLYNKKEKEIPFNFSITYCISGSTEKINIRKNKTNVITTIDEKKVSDPYNKLPKQIVAIYSGEEDRLWKKWFRPIYLDYINNITSGKTKGIGVYNEMPKMLYINKFYWHISLLCLLLQKKENPSDNFCSDILNIKEVHSVKFKFNKTIKFGVNLQRQNILNFSIDNSTLHVYKYDMSGKAMVIRTDNNRVDVRSLPIGSYIINIDTKNGSVSHKFIKK